MEAGHEPLRGDPDAPLRDHRRVKVPDGAWLVIILSPSWSAGSTGYAPYRARWPCSSDDAGPLPRRHERVVVTVNGINRAVVQAVNVGRTLRRHPGGLCFGGSRRGGGPAGRGIRQLPDVPLIVVESPYRALIGPLLAYLDVLDRTWPPGKEVPIDVVILPEFVPATGGIGFSTTRPDGSGPARRPRHGRPRRPVPAGGGPRRAPTWTGGTPPTRIGPPCDRRTTAAPRTQGRRPPGTKRARPTDPRDRRARAAVLSCEAGSPP